MKTAFLLAVILLTPFAMRAQDTIIKRSGDTLVVKLTEVNPYDIRYTLLSYPNGPVFNVLKEHLKEIKYGNGYRELFEAYVAPYKLGRADADIAITTSGKHFYYKEHKINEPDMLGIVARLDDRKLTRMIHNIDELKLFQNITGIIAIPLFISGAVVYRANTVRRGRRGRPVNATTGMTARRNGAILMLCGLGSGIFSLSFMIDRRRNDRILVNTYNATIFKH